MKKRVKISESKNFWKTYFRYTMYQYSDGRIRIIRNADKKLVVEFLINEELSETLIKQLWIWGAPYIDE